MDYRPMLEVIEAEVGMVCMKHIVENKELLSMPRDQLKTWVMSVAPGIVTTDTDIFHAVRDMASTLSFFINAGKMV